MTAMAQSAVSQGNRVLVVDDDPVLRLHARRVLEKQGIAVTEAESGPAALAALREQSFDAVLLDVRMPGMDGLETCRALRAEGTDPHLPILMLTGLDDTDTIEQAFNAGATDFASKPLNWTLLSKRLQWLMRQRTVAASLDASEAHRRLLLDTMPDSMLLLDHKGRVLDAKLSSRHPKDWRLQPGDSVEDGLPMHLAGLFRFALSALQAGREQPQFEFGFGDPGQERHYEVRMVGAGGNNTLTLLRDVSDRVAAEAAVQQLAYYDNLTGLANRSLLRSRLATLVDQAEQHGERLALLRIDLLGLEHLPVMLGAERADRLLQQCVQRLQAAVNQSMAGLNDGSWEALLSRTGEQSFAVLLSGVKEALSAEAFANRLMQVVAGSCQFERYEAELSARIGLAQYPECDDGEKLLELAELALREAALDEPVASYSVQTREQTLQRSGLVRDLRLAVERGELNLVYQPKVSAADSRLMGVEALVRWQRDGQFVSPAEFIPLAEENGLILPIGDLVLYQACRQSRAWRQGGCGVIPIAVNFSGHQFNQHGLVAGLADAMSIYGVPANGIEVELTETVAMQNGERVRSVLSELSEAGISTAIDDFGTGFSSLGSLREFSFNTLKIDRSFIMDLEQAAANVAVLDAIIAMGHALGMKLVAEGVETPGQLAYLRDGGCDLIQGYLTGRPMPAADIAALARRH